MMLWCPACEGGHSIRVPVWGFDGDYDKPTITGSLLSSGVDDQGNKVSCHCLVTAGVIHYLPDCTHKYAGQFVELPELPDWLKSK